MSDELEQLELAGLERPKPPVPVEPPVREPEQYPAPPPILVPGETWCAVCRRNDAEAVLEPFAFGLSRYPLPACLDCIDRLLEREQAASIAGPELVKSLPPLVVRSDAPFRPRPPAYKPQPGDDAKLEELRRQWREHQERGGEG